MSIDLSASLDDLARSVHDDGATARLTGQVQHMVTRIRRRRTVRHAATGAAGIGTAAAMAVGGMQLSGHLGDGRDAAPAADPALAAAVACGTVVPGITPTQETVGLQWGHPDPVAEGEPVMVQVQIDPEGRPATGYTVDAPLVVAVQDGRVVSDPAVQVTRSDAWPPVDELELDLTSCADSGVPLAAGEYELLVVQATTRVDGQATTRAVVTGASSLTVTPAGSGQASSTSSPSPASDAPADADAARAAAELEAKATAALDAVLGQAPVGTFPSCGSAVLTERDPLLELELTLEDRPYAPDEKVGGEVTLVAAAGRSVVGEAPASGATLVLTRAGVVVGSLFRDVEELGKVDVRPGAGAAVPLTGQMVLCSVPATEQPAHALPAGTYEAYAVMDVMLSRVTEADGSVGARDDTVTVRSNPVTVTVR